MKYFILIIVLFISCDEKLEDENEENPVELENPCQLYPLELNNYWVFDYFKSSPDTSFNNEFTLTVTGFDIIDTKVWAQLNKTIDDSLVSANYYLCINDSIYTKQYIPDGMNRALQFIIPTDSIQFLYTSIGGDVGLIKTIGFVDTVVTTPMADFSNCYFYKYSTPDWTEIVIIKYGIGIIQGKIYSHPFMTNDTTIFISTLKEINISNE